MNIVYVIYFKNFHSEDEFSGIFSTEQKAKDHIAKYTKEDRGSFRIEPYEVDEG